LNGVKKIPEGQFCNIYYKPTCSWGWDLNFYVPYSIKQGKQTATLEALRGDGEPCVTDGCCVSGDVCVGGYCVKAGNYPIGQNDSASQFCAAGLNYSLSTHYIDGDTVPSSWNYVNIDNIRTYLGDSGMYAIRVSNNWGDYVSYTKYSSGYGWSFAGWFANDNGKLCYIEQWNSSIYSKCFDSCLSSSIIQNISTSGVTNGSAWIGPGGEFTDTDILCNDDSVAFMGLSTSFFGSVNLSLLSMVHDFTSDHVRINGIWNPNAGAWQAAMWYRGGGTAGGIWYSAITLNLGSATIIHKPAWNPIYTTAPTGIPFLGLKPAFFNGISSWSYSSAILSSYLSPEQTILPVFCCINTVDCVAQFGSGWTCDANKVCQPPGAGNITTGLTVLQLTSTDPAIATGHICTSKTYTLSLDVLNAYTGNRITPPIGTITLTTDAGTVLPSSCTYLPCAFTLTTPGTATPKLKLHFVYSGNSQYQENGGNSYFNVSSTCHIVTIRVYDASVTNTVKWLSYVTVTTNLTGLATGLTNFEGKLAIGGLSYSPFTVNLSKSGYTSAQFTIEVTDLDLQYPVSLPLYPISAPITEPPLTNWTLQDQITVPTQPGEVLTGLQHIILNFFAFPFNWLFLFIILLLCFAAVRLLISVVT
jgi:hypothetical protein